MIHCNYFGQDNCNMKCSDCPVPRHVCTSLDKDTHCAYSNALIGTNAPSANEACVSACVYFL